MRVLFHCRPNLFEFHGGDVVQVLGTKDGLERRGVTVDISTSRDPNPVDYDIFHVFNPALVSMEATLRAKAGGIPIVISTIYWPMEAYYRSFLRLIFRILKYRPRGWTTHSIEAAARYIRYRYFWNPFVERRLRRFLLIADVLLPNSEAEGRMIADGLGVARPWQVVPNGVNVSVPSGDDLPEVIQNLKDYVLCAGRLEPRKNQHLLIESLFGTDLPLVFVGRPVPMIGYRELCREMGRRRGNTYFIDHLPQEALFPVFRRAKVHALPSWYETPGLANLEAAAAGCTIVTTRYGGTWDYFGSCAFYCDPADPASIRDAVLGAYRRERSESLAKLVRCEFTWSVAAAKTLDAYRLAQTVRRSS